MPDLLSHILLARTVALPFRKWDSLFFLLWGAILPDLPAKFLIHFSHASPSAIDITHSLGGILLLTWAISFLFEESLRPRAFGFLFLGALSHILLDVLRISPVWGSPLLFPFSTAPFSGNLFIPEDFVWLAPLHLLMLFAFWKWDHHAN